MSESDIEKEIQDKGLTAPRITPQDTYDEIVSADYHVFPRTTMTVCCLTLKNGYTVIGHSAAASPENFDEDIGRKVAFESARSQIWQHLGFRLRDALALEMADKEEFLQKLATSGVRKDPDDEPEGAPV